MRWLGRLCFFIALPVIRPAIRRTERAYFLICRDDQVLLLKNWLGRQNWALPGGGLKRGEKPLAAARRELVHELGISLGQAKVTLATKGRWQTDRLGFSYSIFICRAEPRGQIKPRWPEVVEAGWVPVRELNKRNCPAEVLAAAQSLILV